MPQSMSVAQARRTILAAQGLAGSSRSGPVTTRSIVALARRLQVIQIDSVNVLSRAHYLPVFSRLGSYDRALLDRMPATGRLFEYWGHEASLLPVEVQPALRWRMAQEHAWSGVADTAADNPDAVRDVIGAVTDLGPATSSELELALAGPTVRDRTTWGWNWSVTKRAIEHLFWSGVISSAGRDASFQRRYDLTERVLPHRVLATPTPEPQAAIRSLVDRSARALGVATAADLQDYFRLSAAQTRVAVKELVESGLLTEVEIPGWPPAWKHVTARVPRSVDGAALLVPFDPLIWDRRRTERVFGMRYRIEIYTPAAKRQYGYYVLPFLLGDTLVARVDLKADRPNRVLLVRGAFGEPDADHSVVAPALAGHLRAMAEWLGLERLLIEANGDLAAALTEAVGLD